MVIDTKKRVNLNISKEAKDKLDELRHTGQSYDGLIRELLVYWKKSLENKEVTKWYQAQASCVPQKEI